MVNVKAELERIAEKTAIDFDEIQAEYKRMLATYQEFGYDEKEAVILALKYVKGRAKAQLRSNAVTVEGFFFAKTPITNVSAFVFNEAQKKIEQYKQEYGENWLEKAVADKIVNENGVPLYTEDLTTQQWLIGRPIPEKQLQRQLYGFVSFDGVVKFAVLYLRDIEHDIELFTRHRFKATLKDNGTYYQLGTVNITEFEQIEKLTLDTDTFEEMQQLILERAKDYAVKFNEVYDLQSKKLLIQNVPNICFSKVVISSIWETEFAYYVEVVDINSDFDSVTMRLEKELYDELKFVEGTIAIIAYRPYFTTRNEEQEPSGQIYGLIFEEKFKVPETEQVDFGDDEEEW